MLSLKKGKIYFCDEKGKAKSGDYLEFSFNPSAYTIKSSVSYKQESQAASTNTEPLFTGVMSREFSTTLFFDSGADERLSLTPGIHEMLNENKLPPVTDKMKKLHEMVAVKGELHAPPLVVFSWGNLNFRGVITSISEEFTMFTMDGKPIRAKAQISIKEKLDADLNKKTSPFESPDRTKKRVVVEGMSLWSLAYEEYDDCEKWRVIAKANRIMNPLDIVPGQVLNVPALT